MYIRIQDLIRRHGLDAAASALSRSHNYLPRASSANLGAAFGEESTEALIAEIARGPVRPILEQTLGEAIACDMDQAWLRRQYAPHHQPPLHAPHGWHQDGALGLDFGAPASQLSSPDALLPTVTCWIALTPCGGDAPALEFVRRDFASVQPVAGLADAQLRNRFPENAFFRPEMNAGDGVIFRGGTLHRTHLAPSMQRDRTSVELRFVAAGAIPARLAGDHFVELP